MAEVVEVNVQPLELTQQTVQDALGSTVALYKELQAEMDQQIIKSLNALVAETPPTVLKMAKVKTDVEDDVLIEAMCRVVKFTETPAPPEPPEENTKSTSKVEVIPIVLEKHPNADTLSIVMAHGGYTVCVRTEDWKDIKLGAYIPPDSIVDTKRPEFIFLSKDAKADGTIRIKAKKLRDVVSFGLLVPAPPGANEGDNIAEQLGVTHYDPEVARIKANNRSGVYLGGENDSAPPIFSVKYDVDALKRYRRAFIDGEPVWVSEKVDGSNARYTFTKGKMYCGSHNYWKREFCDFSHITEESLLSQDVPQERIAEILAKVELQKKNQRRNLWWEVLRNTPTLEKFCTDHPDCIVYGEVFGNQGAIRYSIEPQFAAFDLMYDGKWLDPPDARKLLEDAGVPCVPLLHTAFPYDFDKLCEMAEGPTLVPNCPPGTIREGVVVSPIKERVERSIGRVKLKVVSAAYSLMKKG